ncbi:aldehyde dehydrogenase family protein, partial [Rhodococcus koreensis]|uniref:aldehyde dehydrogenase family protein n=1 Tax=Rhodococcus koreensis TaxID=99653 RepID=UPI00366B101B
MVLHFDHWIDGRTTPGSSGERITSTSPRDGAVVASIPRGTAQDVDAAVQAAAAASAEWRRRKPVERGRLLLELAAAITATADALGSLEAGEAGKPSWQVPLEINGSAAYFEFYGGLVHALHGDTIDMGPDVHCFTRREPFGVVGIITPWNVPLNQTARAAAPALAAGNTVVIKPSEFTSATSLELARLASEVGFPDGVINVVTGTGPEVGAEIVRHRDVRKVAFTGSVRAGQAVAHLAADRIIPLTLELGGKSANIVFADADLDKAVPGSLTAFLLNNGQVCSAGTRLLVQREVHDEVVDRLVAGVADYRVGDKLGPATTEAQFEK